VNVYRPSYMEQFEQKVKQRFIKEPGRMKLPL